MSTATLTQIVPTELDPQVGEQLGDEILLGTAGKERTATVGSTGRRNSGAVQSHQARAWTNAGNVD